MNGKLRCEGMIASRGMGWDCFKMNDGMQGACLFYRLAAYVAVVLRVMAVRKAMAAGGGTARPSSGSMAGVTSKLKPRPPALAVRKAQNSGARGKALGPTGRGPPCIANKA